MFGGDKARMRGIQGGVGVGDVCGRRVGVRWRDHERLGVGRFGLNGDLIRVVSFVDGHAAFSPPDLGVEEPQEWVAEDNAEVSVYDAEGQEKRSSPSVARTTTQWVQGISPPLAARVWQGVGRFRT